jgi:hypothetical protein
MSLYEQASGTAYSGGVLNPYTICIGSWFGLVWFGLVLIVALTKLGITIKAD